MYRLSTRDWRALLEVAAEVVDCQELAGVAATVQDRVGLLVGCEAATCHELDLPGANIRVPAGLAGYPSWARGRFVGLAYQNPLIAHQLRTGETSALRLSDFASARQLHRLELYQRLYRPIGIEHQLAFAFPSRSTCRATDALT